MQLLPIVKMVGGTKRRPLTEIIAHAKVDDEYFEHLNQFRWILTVRTGYPCRGAGKQRHIHLHTQIALLAGWNVPYGVDHKDHDKLNAQLNNLRPADGMQNGANKRMLKRNTTGFKGVSLARGSKNYVAGIKYRRKQYFLGHYADARTAGMAYDCVAIKVFGEFALTNKAMGLLDYTDDEMNAVLDARVRDLWSTVTPFQHDAIKTTKRQPQSGVKGVRYVHGGWQVRTQHLGKEVYVGSFPTILEAAAAYYEATERLRGNWHVMDGVVYHEAIARQYDEVQWNELEAAIFAAQRPPPGDVDVHIK